MKQQSAQSSWWLNKNRAELNAYAQAHAIEMSRSIEARQIDSLQGLRQTHPKPGARSAMRLES